MQSSLSDLGEINHIKVHLQYFFLTFIWTVVCCLPFPLTNTFFNDGNFDKRRKILQQKKTKLLTKQYTRATRFNAIKEKKLALVLLFSFFLLSACLTKLMSCILSSNTYSFLPMISRMFFFALHNDKHCFILRNSPREPFMSCYSPTKQLDYQFPSQIFFSFTRRVTNFVCFSLPLRPPLCPFSLFLSFSLFLCLCS